MKNKICPGKAKVIVEDNIDGGYEGMLANPFRDTHKVKRIRMTCELCGRRLKSSVRTDHDGDYFIHCLPPHKIRFWWKRSRKQNQ